MFPFQQSDDIYYNPHQEDHSTGYQDLIVGQTSNAYNNDKNISHDDDHKKSMRKIIERQRRQQMTTLFGSLRSLLPPEFIKGKRAVADQLCAAVNYIGYLRKHIQEMSTKRDELQNLANSADHDNQGNDKKYVKVRSYWGGVEIVICSGFREEGLLLSKVLGILLEEGLEVVRCASTKANEMLYHTIQSQVDDLARVDLCELDRKLKYLVMSSRHLE